MWWLLLTATLSGGVSVGWWLARRGSTSAAPERHDAQISVEAEGEPSGVERRLARIVEALSLGILVFDETGEQLIENAAVKELSGDRLQGALLHSAIDEVVAEATSGTSAERTLEVFGSSRTHLAIRGVPVSEDHSGQVAVVVTVEDITDSRSTDLLRRDFVANVSHELKTPIGAIGVLAETLLGVDDPDIARRLADRLQNEAFRLSATVDDLLTLARIESGEQRQLTPVVLDEVFAAVVGRVAIQAEARDVAVVVDVEPSGLHVIGDRVQLITGIGNLVDNAVKYSGEGSTVSLRGAAAEGAVTIAVEDHGIGIPEDDLDRIFERFYRVDRARGRDTGGTGLGLSIVRHVLLNHGGSIDVESEEGAGTRFIVTLPNPSDPSRADSDGVMIDEARSGADVG